MSADDTSGKTAITHLSHLDDLTIERGASGLDDFLDIVDRLTTWKDIRITQKYDGAPALVFGVDPRDEKFFVGTKSAMSSDRLIKKISDIRDVIQPTGPRKQVEALFEMLHGKVKLSPGEAYQLDVMYTEEDKTYEKIDGVGHITFCPNTITYAVTYDSPSFFRVMNSKLGVVVHTAYDLTVDDCDCDGYDEEMWWHSTLLWQQSDRELSPLVEELNGIMGMYVRDAYMKVERIPVYGVASEVKPREKSVAKLYRVLLDNPRFVERMKVFINSQLKEDSEMGIFGKIARDEEIKFGELRYALKTSFMHFWKREAEKVKTEKSKREKSKTAGEWMAVVDTYHKQFDELFKVYTKMVRFKNFLHDELVKVGANDWKTFIRTPEGVLLDSLGEGFVIITPKNTVKVVDRTTFSAWNHKLPKKFPVSGGEK